MNKLPELYLADWEKTKMTLHLFCQIIGKIRLKSTHRKNHWWYTTLYVNSRGLTTSGISYDQGMKKLEIQLDFVDHTLKIFSSSGDTKSFDLEEGLTVAEFYKKIMKCLDELKFNVEILDKPYDLPIEKRFSEISDYHHYDKKSIVKFWQILLWVDDVFKEYSGQFYGKTCPVHMYWHSFDLAVTRFSGKRAPKMSNDARISDKDAYTHENISCGFWFGDDNMTEPAFYSYTYPAPVGIDKKELQPAEAFWIEQNGSPMAILKYHDIYNQKDTREKLLAFMQSAYVAGATLAGWPVQDLRVPALNEI